MSAAAPDIASLLAPILGAGGAPPATQPDIGAEAPPAPEAPSDPLDLVRQMIEDGKQFMTVEPHEQHKATVATCLAQLQKILAEDEKDTHGAMQGNISPRQLSRAAAAPSAPPGY